MSTRASIIFTDSHGTKLYFYRHSDGYPETTGEDLKEFCKDYQKKFRNNATQSAGWLIVRGHEAQKEANKTCAADAKLMEAMYGWKVGDYEPTDQIHGDVEYVYVIDLDAMILETRTPRGKSFWDKPTLANTKVIETYSISSKKSKEGAK